MRERDRRKRAATQSHPQQPSATDCQIPTDLQRRLGALGVPSDAPGSARSIPQSIDDTGLGLNHNQVTESRPASTIKFERAPASLTTIKENEHLFVDPPIHRPIWPFVFATCQAPSALFFLDVRIKQIIAHSTTKHIKTRGHTVRPDACLINARERARLRWFIHIILKHISHIVERAKELKSSLPIRPTRAHRAMHATGRPGVFRWTS